VLTKKQQFVVTLMDWFTANHETSLPWRGTTDSWMTLVAAVLLRNTTSKQVMPLYDSFVGRYPSPEVLARETLGRLRQILQPLGLSRTKAAQLREMARMIVRHHNGRVPESRASIESLPGVGDYIASEVLAVAFGRSEPMLDRNLERVLARFFSVSAPASSRSEVRGLAASLVPTGGAREFGYAAIDFAHSVCKLRNPLCSTCPLGQWCDFKRAKDIRGSAQLPPLGRLIRFD